MKFSSPLCVSAVLAAVLTLRLAPGTLAQPCPVTCIEMSWPGRCSSNPTGSWSEGFPDGQGTGSYDLALGTARALTLGQAWATVHATDEYVITGPPDGIPVAITARLVLSGSLRTACQLFDGRWSNCREAFLSITIADSAGSSQFDQRTYSPAGGPPSTSSVLHTLDLPLTKSTGQPFRLDWSVSASSDWYPVDVRSSALGTVTLSFHVPPGVTITSCSGYVGDVVPARPGSWGALKLRYR